jgi:alpha-methylacyl-CoA racemase
MVERGTFVDIDGVIQPGPAPRFSRTTTSTPEGPCFPGQHTDQVLAESGLTALRIEALRRAGVVA